MLTVKEKGLLLNIIKHCEKIETKVHGLTKKNFENNEDVVEIVCFNIFQIGELAKNFTPQFIEKYSNQPWKQIISQSLNKF